MAFLFLYPLVFVWLPLVSSQLTWHLLHTASTGGAPSHREASAIGYVQDRDWLIMFGGKTKRRNVNVVLGDTWLYDIGSDSWQELKPEPSPPARFASVYGASGKYFYVSAGKGVNNILLNDIWKFSVETNTWEELPMQQKPDYYSSQQWDFHLRDEVQPDYRYAAVGGIFPNSSHFYLSHGSGHQHYSDTFKYSETDRGWTREHADQGPYSPGFPHARYWAGGTLISPQELLIFGGCLSGGQTGGPCPSGDSWIFNGKTKKWTQLHGCSSPRMQAAMALLPIKDGERRVVLYGGQDTSSQVISTVKYSPEQVTVLNPDTEEWTLRKAGGAVPSRRKSTAMAAGPDGIYMFGGFDLDISELVSDVYLLSGDSAMADFAPKDADCNPTFINVLLLHGVLMTLSWGFFLVWGTFIARYLKQLREPLWFNLHRLFQVFGLLLALGGLACGIVSVQSDHFRFSHGIIGLAAVIAAVIQPFNALIRPHRPGNGLKKTVRRMLWEFLHHSLGLCTIVLGLANCTMGLFLGLAYHIIWKVWCGYIGLVLLVWIAAEIRKGYREKMTSDSSTVRKLHNKFVISEKTKDFEEPGPRYEFHSLDDASSMGKGTLSAGGS